VGGGGINNFKRVKNSCCKSLGQYFIDYLLPKVNLRILT